MPYVPFQYAGDTICIVGIGALLPGSDSTDSFWKILIEGKSRLTKLYPSRWDSIIENSYDSFPDLHEYLNAVGIVSDDFFIDTKGATRLERMCRKSLKEAIKNIKRDFWHKKNVFVSLGCMSFDEQVQISELFSNVDEIIKYYSKIDNFMELKEFSDSLKKVEKLLPKELLYSVFEEELKTPCTGVIIDAACASSLLAIAVGMKKLKNGEADIVVSGGIESDLGPTSFMCFKELGVLSKGFSLPFDVRSDGMAQGEGVVILVLERLDDAIINGHEILAIIGYEDFLSNGKNASLVSPSVDTLKELYKKALDSIPNGTVDFIECHGTGTFEGDRAELLALSEIIKNRTPIGSVKALIGHTKGTAGAASVLKCILILKHRVIPPSPYFEKPPVPVDKIYINTTPIVFKDKLLPLSFWTLSAGFGGINGLVSIYEYSPWMVKPFEKKKAKKIVVCGYGSSSLTNILEKFLDSSIRIPFSTLKSVDVTQLAAIIAVTEAFERSSLNFTVSTKISVISAADMDIKIRQKIAIKLQGNHLIKVFNSGGFDIRSAVSKIVDMIPDINEDTATGSLTSLIAGRVCHFFDFHGKHYNVDSKENPISAIELAELELNSKTSEMVIVILIDEVNKTVFSLCLSEEDTAIKRNWPCFFEIETL